ncbi:MAG: class I SAM-dependent methyltransferase [Elusimicrobia bacterium]|nr:class I SAM-dependent methyltransferase [Elusimicrobiota bacterium]
MSSEPVDQGLYDEDYYRESCGGSEFYRLYGPRTLKPQLAYALRLGDVSAGKTVLDLGCGRGELLYHVEKAGARGVGTDYAAAALGVAKENAGGRVLRCDAKALPFVDAAFDRAFLLGVVDHLHDWELERCFEELSRVLKPGGFVVLHTCTNRLHYKTLTYAARARFARGARRLGLPMKDPRRPRSDEDESLHVNEHSQGDLERFFSKIGWQADIEAMPNYKSLVGRLYGDRLPEGFPLKAYAPWRAALARGTAKTPLAPLLAREFFVVARPRRV